MTSVHRSDATWIPHASCSNSKINPQIIYRMVLAMRATNFCRTLSKEEHIFVIPFHFNHLIAPESRLQCSQIIRDNYCDQGEMGEEIE